MNNFEIYNLFCALRGISACRYESLKEFVTDYPEFCK